MANRVLPVVRFLLPCDDATFDLGGEFWQLRNPWAGFVLPPGAKFPFRHEPEVWIYAQLVGGIGTVRVAVEFLQVRDNGELRSVGVGPLHAIDFTTENQLVPLQTTFELQRLPFRSEGLYAFRLVAEVNDGYRELDGQTFQFRVLEQRSVL